MHLPFFFTILSACILDDTKSRSSFDAGRHCMRDKDDVDCPSLCLSRLVWIKKDIVRDIISSLLIISRFFHLLEQAQEMLTNTVSSFSTYMALFSVSAARSLSVNTFVDDSVFVCHVFPSTRVKDLSFIASNATSSVT